MVPGEVDVPQLAQQLKQDGVAYSAPSLESDTQLNAHVAEQLREGDGLAVVDVFVSKSADRAGHCTRAPRCYRSAHRHRADPAPCLFG